MNSNAHIHDKRDIAIITEGEFDAKVLKKLLSGKAFNNHIDILSANGYSSALSKVKSLLTLRNKKVILLLDTDTVENDAIKEKEDFVNYYINTTLNKDNFKAFWAIPEFEIVFLNNKKFVEELTHQTINDELMEFAKTSPKKLLATISKQNREQYMTLLDNEEIREEFFKDGLIKEIYDYIDQ